MDFSGFEKLSLVDYEGKIAATLFSGGCNMRCPFCHNGELVLHPERGPKVHWDEVISYLNKRIGLIEGVVFSGGEPLIYPDIAERIAEVKGMGFLTKLDTNGSFPDRLRRLMEEGLLDYVAMDIKNSLGKYPLTVGVKDFPTDGIKESANLLINGSIDYEFRTTLIDEFHEEEDFREIAEWTKGAKRFFLQLYHDRDGCIEHGFTAVPKEKALMFRAILEEAGIEASLRGYD